MLINISLKVFLVIMVTVHGMYFQCVISTVKRYGGMVWKAFPILSLVYTHNLQQLIEWNLSVFPLVELIFYLYKRENIRELL